MGIAECESQRASALSHTFFVFYRCHAVRWKAIDDFDGICRALGGSFERCTGFSRLWLTLAIATCYGKFFKTERQFFETFADRIVDISFIRAAIRSHSGQNR